MNRLRMVGWELIWSIVALAVVRVIVEIRGEAARHRRLRRWCDRGGRA